MFKLTLQLAEFDIQLKARLRNLVHFDPDIEHLRNLLSFDPDIRALVGKCIALVLQVVHMRGRVGIEHCTSALQLILIQPK